MDGAKNCTSHEIDEIINDIKQDGYAQRPALYIINLFKKEINTDFFKNLNLKLEQKSKMFEFRYINIP